MNDHAHSAETRNRLNGPIPLAKAGTPLEDPVCKVALRFQSKLETGQWQTPEEHRERQLRHLGDIVRHARDTVPFYRDVLGGLPVPESGPVNLELWRSLPIVSRRMIQDMPERFRSKRLPPSHGRAARMLTSGSTGMPLSVYRTQFTNAMHDALTLRAFLWHGFHFDGTAAIIRWFPDNQARAPGASGKRWSAKSAIPFATGPSHMLDVRASIQEQTDWLLTVNPDYLLVFPTALFGIVQELRERGRRPARLKGIQTFGETVTPDLRATVRDHLGIDLYDVYSSQEMGIMAMQCADRPVYHVQSEAVFLEVLNESDQEVDEGETGRVVVTNLHNYAMPILRYEHGDYATAGGRCACGRGLPVLTEIMGRLRNLFVLPDGRSFWPVSHARYFHEIAPIRQYRVIQTTVRDVEVELVCDEPIGEDQQEELIRHVKLALPAPFDVKLRFVDQIPRTAGGKYDEFICRVPGPGGQSGQEKPAGRAG